MGSQGGGGAIQENKSQSVSRQGSLYGLTLDEVQNQLGGSGKPLGSMNLDELLKSVFSAEANTQGPSLDIDHIGVATEQGEHGLLPRQPSFTLSSDLSKKTVDEVWKDIQLGKRKSNLHVSENSNHHEGGNQERNQTLGEITLEDFLVKAGVVTESSQVDPNAGTVVVVDSVAAPPQNAPPHVQWMPYQLPSVQQQQQNVMTVFMPSHHTVQQPMAIGCGPMLDPTYPDMHATVSPSSLMGTLSDTQTPGRKRVAPGDVVEKTVERRQKRMIKNRESAARSRARKQAYTNELENKVSRLEEENAWLRRQREDERALPCAPPPKRKNQLRRISSAPF